MKKLLLSLPLLAINLTVASQPVLVTGIGENKELAKENAIVQATETYCGLAVVSDKKFKDRKTVRNDVVTSSSCLIQSTKLVKEEIIGDSVKVTLEVTLQNLPISERILSTNNQYTSPETYNWKTQIDSYNSTLDDRDRLLRQVLADFPYNAFNIKQKDAFIYFDNRMSYFVVPYIINWNPNYVKALQHTFKLVAKEVGSRKKLDYGYPIEFSYEYSFKDKKYYVSDYKHFEIIKTNMQKEPYVHLTITMTNGKTLTNCAPIITKNNVQVGDFYHFSQGDYGQITIYQNSEKAFYIDIEKYNIKPDHINDIELKIVSFADCKNY